MSKEKKQKKTRSPRLASSKNGYKTMSQIYGDAYSDKVAFTTYREMTEKWNEDTGEGIKTNTMCVRYHNAMLKIARGILHAMHPDRFSEEEIKTISRSVEFQVYIRDMMEQLDADEAQVLRDSSSHEETT